MNRLFPLVDVFWCHDGFKRVEFVTLFERIETDRIELHAIRPYYIGWFVDLGKVLGRVGVPNLVIYLPFSMQVYPQFAIGVIFYAWILLIVEAVEGTAHNIIELC